MNNIRHKIRHDLWANRARTLQVILIIGMGAFAIGMIVGTRDLVIDGISDIWQTTSPASIALSAMPPIDDETLDGLRRIEGVEDVEGFTTLTIEWRLHADKPWQPAGLTARDDYDDQRYSKLDLVSGAWPNEAVFAVEQGGDTAFGLPTGSEATIRVNDREYPIRIGGVVYNPVGMPPSFGGTAQFYTTRNRLGELTGSCSFNRILAGMTSYDEAGATDIASQMQRKLENQGVQSAGATVFMSRTADPVKHFFQDILDGVFLLLGVMAALALLLGLFLVYNTINAIISQQIDQIGVMKAIGATTGQILAAFLLTVFAYGVMALLIAIPLGIAGAWLLNGALLDFFNVAAGALRVSKTAVFIQIAIALLTPLLAALIPILSGARITVREAINSYGLSAGAGLLERWLARFERVSRLVLLTISNTFRHKGRVALTQISLILSGVIFMMVMGVRDSAQHTYSDVLASILRFDVNFSLAEPERIEPLTALTLTHPQVTAVELWQTSGETIHRTDTPASDDDERTLMFGVPLPTELYAPQIRNGRWLTPSDTNSIVINQKLAAQVGIGVGDWVTFEHGLGEKTEWQVVGLLFDPTTSFSVYVPQTTMAQTLGDVGKANMIWLQTDATAAEMRQFYEANRIDLLPQGVLRAETAVAITEQSLSRVSIIITLLGTMAVVIGLVGSIALSGVLSLNVLERRREIGVMRAIGASSAAVTRLLIGEGLILGLLSWAIALPLSIPAAKMMAQLLGETVRTEMVYRYTPTGTLAWLGIITLLSIAASWFPARTATRISVQESLAYQ